MRKAAVLLVSVATVLIIVGGFMTQSLLVLQRVAAVDSVAGMVWIQPRGQHDFLPLADRPRVGAGDTIRTDARSSVNLQYVDGTRVRVGPNARLTVLKDQINSATKAETTMLKLDVGRVWIRILKVLSQKSKFDVLTPTATAGVRGTIFSVEVTPEGKTVVSVKEGEVAVKSGQAEQEVARGQMMRDGKAEAMPADEQTLWDENEAVALPYLEIKQPTGAVTAAPRQMIEVSGVAEPGATVTVNGQPQTLRLEKLFSAQVQAPDKAGKSEIVVEVKDRRGYVTRRVVAVEVR